MGIKMRRGRRKIIGENEGGEEKREVKDSKKEGEEEY